MILTEIGVCVEGKVGIDWPFCHLIFIIIRTLTDDSDGRFSMADSMLRRKHSFSCHISSSIKYRYSTCLQARCFSEHYPQTWIVPYATPYRSNVFPVHFGFSFLADRSSFRSDIDLHWSNLKLSLADLGETWQVYSINFKDISDSIHPFERIVHTAVGSLYLCFNPAPLFLQSLLSLTPWPLVFSCLIEVGVSENLQYDFFIHSQPRNYIHEEPVIGSLLVCFHNIKNVNLTTSDCLIDTVCLHRKSE